MLLKSKQYWILLSVISFVSACGGGGGNDSNAGVSVEDTSNEIVDQVEIVEELGPLDATLLALINRLNLTGNPALGRNLPSIAEPMPQLGKDLFFTKNLGGVKDTACVSCHHPVLGGGDALSLSVGVSAVNSNDVVAIELLGLGRFHDVLGGRPAVPRNAPTVFNVGFWDRGLFWDSRVASLGAELAANGQGSGITTPDSTNINRADNNLPAGASLPAAQARFPVTSNDEMRAGFESEANNQALRASLALRFSDDATQWPQRFREVYGDDTITFDRIAESIGEYERSMVFVDNAWKSYIDGDLTALSDQQKRGAVLFLNDTREGGAGCAACHSGDNFSDERHHLIAFPQIGPGKADVGVAGATDDFGREQVTGRAGDRYHFRTSSLLNIALTAPYGHAGAYQNLEQVVRHYINPAQEVSDFFGVQSGIPYVASSVPFCELPQLAGIIDKTGASCASLYPDAYVNSQAALQRLSSDEAAAPLRVRAGLNEEQVQEVVAFLQALTDRCTESRECLNDWIVDEDDVANFPDLLPLIAEDSVGVIL